MNICSLMVGKGHMMLIN